MGRPLILIDNVLNPRIYPSHTLAASSTETDTDVLNLSAGRRRRSLGGWFASTLNAEAYVESTFDRLRAFNCVFCDRDHNLAGETVRVRISNDAFTTYSELGPWTIPAAPTPYTALYDGEAVVTDEGAFLIWLELQTGWAVRFVIDAMGAGLRPELAGLMIGFAWAPEHAALKPFDYGNYSLLREVVRSPQAQSAGSQVGRYRPGSLRLRMASWAEYATARYPLEELWTAGRGIVLVHDDEQAERAFFVTARSGQSGFVVPQDRYLPEIELSYEETEPVLL